MANSWRVGFDICIDATGGLSGAETERSADYDVVTAAARVRRHQAISIEILLEPRRALQRLPARRAEDQPNGNPARRQAVRSELAMSA